MSEGWIEWRKRKNRPARAFIRDRINGRQVVVVKNAGLSTPIANKVLRAYQDKKAAGTNPAALAFTVQIDEALEAWIRDERKEPETIEGYRNTIQSFKDHAKIIRVNEIDKTKADAWRYAMERGELKFSRNEKTYYQYSESTIWSFMKNLRAFLKFCFRREWVSAATASMIRLTTPHATRRFLTKVEVARLIKACRVERYLSRNGGRRTTPEIEEQVIRVSLEHPELGYITQSNRLQNEGIALSPGGVRKVWARYGLLTAARRTAQKLGAISITEKRSWRQGRNPNNSLRKIMLFGIYTGMRMGEVLRARWENMTTEEVLSRAPNGSIVSKIVYVLFIPIAKGDKQRSAALHPTMARILGAHKYFGKRTGLLFPDWTEGKLAKARLRAVERAGLDRVRFHDLRHSFVRNYLKSGAGTLPQVRGQTGHSGLTSLQPYAHFSTHDLASTISKMKIQ